VRRRLVLMWPIAMSHPMVMVMATARSQKATPISPISPIRCGRRRCIKPREVLSLETVSKFRGAGLKPVAGASRLVLAAKLFRRDARHCESERTNCRDKGQNAPKQIAASPRSRPSQMTQPHGAMNAAQ
jgi:hypothetical protein